MKVIAVNLDDTLNNFTEVLEKTDFLFEPGYDLSEADFTLFINQIRAGFDEENNLLSTPFSFFKNRLYLKCYNLASVRPSAAIALRRLKRDGWKICICTKRDLRRAIASTKNWLHANHVPYDYIFMVPDLARFCKDWNIDALMDCPSTMPNDDEHCVQNSFFLSLSDESAEKSEIQVLFRDSKDVTDAKLETITRFYSGLPLDSVKVETQDYGWEFLDRLLAQGGELDYGETAGPEAVYKYKFQGLPETTVDRLLNRHIGQTCNVCCYFSEGANSCCCINLDANLKIYDNNIGVEMNLLVRSITNAFLRFGIETLVVISGRGYHIWCLFTERISNEHLFRWMLHRTANAISEIYGKDMYGRIKANFFPDPRVLSMASLRLFGTKHATTGKFSHMLARGEVLNESDSWNAFRDHIAYRKVTRDKFYESYAASVLHRP